MLRKLGNLTEHQLTQSNIDKSIFNYVNFLKNKSKNMLAVNLDKYKDWWIK